MNSKPERYKPRIFTKGTFGFHEQDEKLAEFLNTLREKDPKRKRNIQRITSNLMIRMNKDFMIVLSLCLDRHSETFERVYNLIKKDLEDSINSKNFSSHLKTRLFACLNERFEGCWRIHLKSKTK